MTGVGRLREHDYEPLSCAECRKNDPVGPCASCESMICGDCCVLTTDPVGKKGICLSCARLIASVDKKRPERRPTSAKAIAAIVLLVFAIATVIALAR